MLGTGATPTVFDGVASLAGLAVADQAEVHGSIDAGLGADRQPHKPKTVKVVKAGDGAALEVGGRLMVFVSQADLTASGVRIDASAATLNDGHGGRPGQWHLVAGQWPDQRRGAQG